jgi:hypothetical protein
MPPGKLIATNPKDSHDANKEAVVDSILNILSARLSGAGEYGQYLYRGKPRAAISTAFIMPVPLKERDGDEEASPIQISTHGLDFSILRKAEDIHITVAITGCVYVRIYPTASEVGEGGICEPVFPLNKEKNLELRERVKAALKQVKNRLGPNFYKNPEWPSLSVAARKIVYTDMGLRYEEARDAEAEVEQDVAGAEEADRVLADSTSTDVSTGGVKVKGTEALSDGFFEPVIPPQKWLRLDLNLPSFTFNVKDYEVDVRAGTVALNEAIDQQLKAWAEDPDLVNGGKCWGFRHGTTMLPSDARDWDAYLARVRQRTAVPVLPSIELQWAVQLTNDTLDISRRNIHIAVENWSVEPTTNRFKESEESVFQVALSVSLPSAVHKPLSLDRVEPSYRYQAFLQYPALGYNGGVIATTEGADIRLKTTWTPRFLQPRIIPTDVPGVVAEIAALSKENCIPGLTPLISAYDTWLAQVKSYSFEAGIDPADLVLIQNERAKFHDDLHAWELEKAAIQAGIGILAESRKHWSGPGPQASPRGIPFEAWVCMNAAMAQVAVRKGYKDWRLFQLAFILANIPAFATRIPEFKLYFTAEVAEYADAVTLLYFSTGGGKSEAFFGLLLFVLFIDRLRGKERGVSAMLRYPLRLLTLQQAQRAAKAMAQAEVIRIARKHPGEAFSLGFWVGGSNTPNHLSEPELKESVPSLEESPLHKETELRKASSYKMALERWNKLPSCPFCNADTALRLFGKMGGALGHACLNKHTGDKGCAWNESHALGTPLPFYIVDEDIYSFAPSVLLGTVDKLSALGHSQKTIRKFYGLFGFSPWWDPATNRLYIPDNKELREGPGTQYKPLFPSYASGLKRFFDPMPSLMIQDEAHLLDESLGTFAGLFETALEAAFDALSPMLKNQQTFTPDGAKRRRLKVVAASATVNNPERQMRSLYQREKVVQFPCPGHTLYDSFYILPMGPDRSSFDTERSALPYSDAGLRNHWARVYQSILTNGRTHTVTMVATLASFHLTITSLHERLKSGDPEQQNAVRDELIQHVTAGPLHSQHTRLLQIISINELATLIDLHRISLTYVTNKKGGDQLIDAERMEFEKLHKGAGFHEHQLASELITGAVDAGQIQAVVARAEQKPKPGSEFIALNDTLRSIIATSAVSHGVDVEELNSMFFAGMPSDIAEYIQASSRVGRTHIGFCVLVPTPQRQRDRYIVEVHDIFHRFLERMITPAAIDRWAENALQRVIPSFFQTYLCGVRAIQGLVQAPDDEKSVAPRYSLVKDIRKLVDAHPLKEKTAIARFLATSFGVTAPFEPVGAEYYRGMAESAIANIMKDMMQPRFESTQLKYFLETRLKNNRPMTSLRDVDEPGIIVAYNREPRDTRPVKPEALEKVLRFIRGGSGADIDNSKTESDE